MTNKNSFGATTVRTKGAASKNDCARHYVWEMENAIKQRQDTIVGYADSDRAAKDQEWLVVLKDRAGIVDKEETKKKVNPIKASKRM